MSWQANLESKPWSATENLRIWRKRFDGPVEVLQPFQFKSYDAGIAVPDNEIAIVGDAWGEDVRAFLQCMMDTAWKAGLRPIGHEDHTNELKAVRDHLADMRALALSDRVEISGAPTIEIAGLKA